jgi:hypothetical protein
MTQVLNFGFDPLGLTAPFPIRLVASLLESP